MATQGRLIRLFPAKAIQVSKEILDEEGFRASLANTMSKMSQQTVKGMRPEVSKAGQMHVEERDTTNPLVVTELLAGILLGCGDHAPVSCIQKNTRDDVVWNSSKLPWRRSPTWLLVRVTLQLSFLRMETADAKIYKKFFVYFLAHILEAATLRSLDSEILHTMSAKVARRLTKLQHSGGGAWLAPVRQAMEETTKLLDARWLAIRKGHEYPIDFGGLSSLNLERDIRLDLPKLDEFLCSVACRQTPTTKGTMSPPYLLPLLPDNHLPQVSSQSDSDGYKAFRLAAIEGWVATNLSSWTQDNCQRPETCEELAALLFEYHKYAQRYYENSPEGTSRMLLVLLEIWTALDKSAMMTIPLMRDYSPEVPMVLFQGLLLARVGDMARLHRAERHMLDREASAQDAAKPSIFVSFGHSESFSVRFFDQSGSHQSLRHSIEEQARKDRQAKLRELHSLKEEYTRLMNLYSKSPCEFYGYTDSYGDRRSRHSSHCSRCNYQKQARDLKITVHEWPLPRDSNQAKSTVFELDLPSSFRAWRDATVYLIDDVLRSTPSEENRPGTSYPLGTYDGLLRWHKAATYSIQRIAPLSDTKPHTRTHRNEKYIDALDEDDVCVNNGLRLQMYDDVRGIFVSRFNPTNDIFEACTVKLPPRSVKLTPYVLRDLNRPHGKLPNEALAEQHLCPSHLSLGEGKALMSLSYGHESRWLSLLVHLESPQVDFSKQETATFVLLICLRAGPKAGNKVHRQSYELLTEERFASQLACALEHRIDAVEKNPECYIAIWCFSLLASKALTMNRSHRQAFLAILSRCRKVSSDWVMQLSIKSLQAETEDQRMQFREMMFDIALVCLDTFNLDLEHLEGVMDTPMTPLLFEMSILVRDNVELRKPHREDRLGAFLFDRWHTLMHRSSPIVQKMALLDNVQALDKTIRNCWAAYRREQPWSPALTAGYWLETRSSSLQVLFNTLTGELLVGGVPLSRLPTRYRGHPTYVTLFGRVALDVRPSPLAGMSFSSTSTFHGREVHFGMQESVNKPGAGELLLLTKDEGGSQDLVPAHVFRRYIPDMFVDSFVHWYDHNGDEVQLRPLSAPWVAHGNGWRLKRFDGAWALVRGSEHVIGPSSEAGTLIKRILAPLDTAMHLCILHCRATRGLVAQLPRLGLDFDLHMSPPALRSRQFPDMQTDENQSIGTLVGLSNKLVLRQTGNADCRMVLVPEGDFEVTPTIHDHVNVSLVYGTASRVQSYYMDVQLGRLTDNGTLQSKLFLSYLHALTAHCNPDPFTMCTGTEQALSILSSAALRSWDTLLPKDAKLLARIANLSPGREYYPGNLRVMQKVAWKNELSYLAQHGRFRVLVEEMMQHFQRVQFLYPNQSTPTLEINHIDMHLLRREAIRSASLYVAGFGAEDFKANYDSRYRPRDEMKKSEASLRATRVASQVLNKYQSLDVPASPELLTKVRDFLAGSKGTINSARRPAVSEIQYDSRWVDRPH